jgi:hypothetical protein
VSSQIVAAILLVLLAAGPAAAELPEAGALLAELGLSPDEIARVKAGELVHHSVTPASERELTAGLAFQVDVPPAKLVADLKGGLVDHSNPDTIALGDVAGTGSAADFARLTLEPDRAKRAQAYVSASPGGDLNLSAGEITDFQKLGGGASPDAVEGALRAALLARLQAYRAQGLAGIAPYARGGGKERSAAEELRTASSAMKALQKHVPAAYGLLLTYPQGKPPGTEERFRWSQFQAHGVPTIDLSHVLFIPEGDGWLVVQRQFYVSTGYNAEQAVAAFLPAQAGTVVVYGNRTSTDQITGFGGSAKRSLGSKLLASQLESLFERVRKAAQ